MFYKIDIVSTKFANICKDEGVVSEIYLLTGGGYRFSPEASVPHMFRSTHHLPRDGRNISQSRNQTSEHDQRKSVQVCF